MKDAVAQRADAKRAEPPHGFRALLACLFSLLILPAHFPAEERHLFWIILLSVCLLTCLYLVANRKSQLIFGGALAAAALVASWGGLFAPGVVQLILSCALYVAFFAYIAIFLSRYLFHSEKISENMIFASVCLYLIVGLIWGFAYFIIEIMRPNSISIAAGQGTFDPYSTLNELLYFSFVTLSTLGYGDVAPVTRIARSWAVIEAVFGQFYLAIVVARLVGLHITSSGR